MDDDLILDSGTEKDEVLPPVKVDALRRLLRLIVPHKGKLILAGILMILSSGLSLALPLFAREGVDRVVKSLEQKVPAPTLLANLDGLVLAIVALILVSAVLGFTHHILVSQVGNRVVADLRSRIFGHLQRLPVTYFDRTRSGELGSRISTDTTQVQQTLTSDVVELLPNVITLLGGIGVALFIDWRLTLVVVVLLAGVMSLFVVFGRRLRDLNKQILREVSDSVGVVTEALSNIRLVKAFGREAHEERRAKEKFETIYGLGIKSSIWEGAMGAVAGVGFILLMVGVIWYGGRNVVTGVSTPGSLIAFFMTVTIIAGPMGSLASLYTRLQRALAAGDRIFAILEESPESPDLPTAGAFPSGPVLVELQEVRFSYTPENPVLQGISLSLEPGQVTALVGQSGGGKTTIASLIYRFYEPQEGKILINGVALDQIRREDLRSQIGIVPQLAMLFNGTLWDNIRYGNLEASDDQVREAARLANVDEFVSEFSEGYQTIVGERGITLSGGQAQRVSIARAILKNPRILILDEATSALDNRNESLVRQALERLMQGRTTLVIAHRLSTIQSADTIVVLDQGVVAEQGTHEELTAKAGIYSQLQAFLPEMFADGTNAGPDSVYNVK